MGTVFGAVSAFASLGMASGRAPAAGSTTTRAYTWLYIGSFAIGLAAVAVALSFSKSQASQKAVARSRSRRRLSADACINRAAAMDS